MDFPMDGVELYGVDMYTDLGSFEFLPPFVSTPEDSSEVSSSVPYFQSSMEQYFLPWEESSITSRESLSEVKGNTDFCDQWMEIENWREICTEKSEEIFEHKRSSLIFPEENTKLDNQLSICHLLKAYGEAMEYGQAALVDAILSRIQVKACPAGETVQRLAHYLVQSLDTRADNYLRQEASKIYKAAFLAFYQIFPYGRFAHFKANSAILDAVPEDAEVIQIVDFDTGEGLQWPPLIESLGQQKGHRTKLRIISIKWEEEKCNSAPSLWRFEETKKRLNEHARFSNLELRVEEMEMENLASVMKKRRGGGREFLAFNCMAGLPHMGGERSVRHVVNFLKVAKDSIKNGNKGIITFGDGNVEERERECSGFGCFLEGKLVHFHALVESMDMHFPLEFVEARIAMEWLFVAPYFASLACLKKWEESNWGSSKILEIGLEPWTMRKYSVAEAKELVREGESPYWVRIAGESENQMVLGHMGSPLVRVSCWR